MPKLHTYMSKDITVTWMAYRCIHASGGVHRQTARVFDPREDCGYSGQFTARLVANVILDCPTRLYYASDRVKAELPDRINAVMIRPHGPLYVRGDL
ncbi:MAG: hypothetical protein IPP40_13120, partial [bacterium]|nr:hypothetical protein [bacterium]